MAVASFQREGKDPIMRGFDPPRTASLTHWYKAATARQDFAPNWREIPQVIENADVDEDTIIFRGADWTLFVARKRFMK